jgi:hypothetical protein
MSSLLLVSEKLIAGVSYLSSYSMMSALLLDIQWGQYWLMVRGGGGEGEGEGERGEGGGGG